MASENETRTLAASDTWRSAFAGLRLTTAGGTVSAVVKRLTNPSIIARSAASSRGPAWPPRIVNV